MPGEVMIPAAVPEPTSKDKLDMAIKESTRGTWYGEMQETLLEL